MSFFRRAFGALIAAALCTSSFARPPQVVPTAAGAKGEAQTIAWPTRPIRLLIGFPPGSVQDLSARAISESLSQVLGQPVIVENKSGASGTIAANLVAKSTDEHTFGVMNNSQLTIAKLLNPDVPYDPSRDLAPVALIGTTPMMLVVSKDVPGNSPRDLLTALRNEADDATYGSPGVGTPGHLGMELIKMRGALFPRHIPYQGNPQIINALMAGQLKTALLPPGLAMQQVKAGKMKAIGITSEERSPLAPGQPTLRESGVFGADMELWTAMAAPATLPEPIRKKMEAAVLQALKSDACRQRLLAAGWEVAGQDARGLHLKIASDTRTFGGIIIMRNIHTAL